MARFEEAYIGTAYAEDKNGSQFEGELRVEDGDTSDSPNARELALAVHPLSGIGGHKALIQLDEAGAKQLVDSVMSWLNAG